MFLALISLKDLFVLCSLVWASRQQEEHHRSVSDKRKALAGFRRDANEKWQKGKGKRTTTTRNRCYRLRSCADQFPGELGELEMGT